MRHVLHSDRLAINGGMRRIQGFERRSRGTVGGRHGQWHSRQRHFSNGLLGIAVGRLTEMAGGLPEVGVGLEEGTTAVDGGRSGGVAIALCGEASKTFRPLTSGLRPLTG